MNILESWSNTMKKLMLLCIVFSYLSSFIPAYTMVLPSNMELEQWLSKMMPSSTEKLLHSITPAALTTDSSQPAELYLHRNAAMALSTLMDIYAEAPPGSKLEASILKNVLEYLLYLKERIFSNYAEGNINFLQSLYPEYYHDAPALQALSLVKIYQSLALKGEKNTTLFDLIHRKGEDNTKDPELFSLLRPHVDVALYHWQDPSYDLWGMATGDHVWTKMILRKSLLTSLRFYYGIKDPICPSFNEIDTAIVHIRESMVDHWDSSHLRIVENLVYNEGIPIEGKESGPDMATILASLRGGVASNFEPEDDRVQSTFYQIIESMKFKFGYQEEDSHKGVGVGRVPEDRNAPFVSAFTASEYLFVLGKRWIKYGHIIVGNNRPLLLWLSQSKESEFPPLGSTIYQAKTTTLFNTIVKGALCEGDQFLKSVQHHLGEREGMKQYFQSRFTFGKVLEDDTWSHIALLEAARQRKEFLMQLKESQ